MVTVYMHIHDVCKEFFNWQSLLLHLKGKICRL